jgi:TPR repeat protein
MYILAQLYMQGVGVQPDLEAAKSLLRESAAMGWGKSNELLQIITTSDDDLNLWHVEGRWQDL